MNTAFAHSVYPATAIENGLGHVTHEIRVTDFVLGDIAQVFPNTDPQPPWQASQKFTPLNTQETEKTRSVVYSHVTREMACSVNSIKMDEFPDQFSLVYKVCLYTYFTAERNF